MLFTSKSIKTHVGYSKEKFIAELSEEGITESISAAVFDFYKQKARYEKFNPSPGMDLIKVFGELPEDVDDAAVELLRLLHLEAPTEALRQAWPGNDIYTAADMARWLAWASANQPK